ncbi:MAG: TIGR03905 family TSCPD domain-containing protein [Clostridia bacterium]|nr:TIGR03905 family TSCPD domain-containing protein [Clostridia bacterium]
MSKYSYKPTGVCSSQILFEVDNNTVHNVEYIGGCNGNTQGIGALIEGMDRDEAIKRLRGIDCRGRGTSCPDQLAIALEQSKQN